MSRIEQERSLEAMYPELAKEWHPTKNGQLKPNMVSPGSGKKVWWAINYYDDMTNKVYWLEWQAAVVHRVNGKGCPYLAGKMVQKGFNDLESRYPNLAKEWHFVKNGALRPDMVTAGSGKKVWWQMKYHDERTGKDYNFEWQAAIFQRVNGEGCPYLTGKQVMKGFSDLESRYPDLAKEWHPSKNGSLQPDQVSFGSNKKVWWLADFFDEINGQVYQFEWQASIKNRVNGKGCPHLAGKMVHKGFNDLESQYPDLAKEWHFAKNGTLRPDMVTAGSGRKVWWQMKYHDEKNGKDYTFEWQAVIFRRVNGEGCPYLTGKQVIKGFSDLESRYPNLAKEWHPSKNGSLQPDQISFGSNKKVWWITDFFDERSGQIYCFEWQDSVKNRVEGKSCPYLTGKLVQKGFNDLESCYPDLAKEWHPTKNRTLKPDMVTIESNKKVWWMCTYYDSSTGKQYEFEWMAGIQERLKRKSCPYLTGRRVMKGFNDLESRYPDLAKEWHPTKNNSLTAAQIIYSSRKKVWWQIKYFDVSTSQVHIFEWRDTVFNRIKGAKCPYLTGKKVKEGFNDLKSQYPELAMEWHPTKNRQVTPEKICVTSNRDIWWKCNKCGNIWMSPISSRVNLGYGCLKCEYRPLQKKSITPQ